MRANVPSSENVATTSPAVTKNTVESRIPHTANARPERWLRAIRRSATTPNPKPRGLNGLVIRLASARGSRGCLPIEGKVQVPAPGPAAGGVGPFGACSRGESGPAGGVGCAPGEAHGLPLLSCGDESGITSTLSGLRDIPARSNTHRSIYRDRKSTRLNSSHVAISYAVFCLKKKKLNRCHFL